MISFKGGERGFAPGPKEIGAQELKKLGVDNIGEFANKLSDAQWTDPEKELRAVGDSKMGKDAFLTLMLTQMKHQDPTNPMQSHEMAAQLAQFTSLEQLQNINTTLESMKEGQKPVNDFQALQFIGKVVSGDSSKVIRAEGDKEHDFRFELPQKAASVEVKVKNQLGETIRTYSLMDMEAGENKVTWNGKSEQGVAAGAGEYVFEIQASTADGKKLAIDTTFEGSVSGMNYTPTGPVLLIGNKSIRLRDVKKIIDPSIQQNDQKVKDVTALDLSQSKDKKQNEGSQAAIPAAGTLMNNVGMDRGMMNKLSKLEK